MAPFQRDDLNYFDIQPESGWIFLRKPLDVSSYLCKQFYLDLYRKICSRISPNLLLSIQSKMKNSELWSPKCISFKKYEIGAFEQMTFQLMSTFLIHLIYILIGYEVFILSFMLIVASAFNWSHLSRELRSVCKAVINFVLQYFQELYFWSKVTTFALLTCQELVSNQLLKCYFILILWNHKSIFQ